MRLILTFLFLITAVALFFSQTRPYLSDIKVLKLEKQEYEEALANSRELQKLRDELLSRYNAISQSDIGRLNKLLPVQADSGNLIVMLENRARFHSLLLKKIDAKEEIKQSTEFPVVLGAPPPPYKTLVLSLSVSGPYASVLSFLTDVEKSLRLIDVDSISFSSASADMYEFNIGAKTYLVSDYVPSPVVSENAEKGENVKEILTMLAKLKSIKIDSEFFGNEIFRSLIDFVPQLEMPKDHGRPNPFAPL